MVPLCLAVLRLLPEELLWQEDSFSKELPQMCLRLPQLGQPWKPWLLAEPWKLWLLAEPWRQEPHQKSLNYSMEHFSHWVVVLELFPWALPLLSKKRLELHWLAALHSCYSQHSSAY